MGKQMGWLTATALAALSILAAGHASAANCIADKPPNPQPATSQPVPPVFCLTGATGQHYYLWTIPVSSSGYLWTVKLESLPGEETRLLIQSLDHDPRKGLFNYKTLWQGASNGKTSNIASPGDRPPLSDRPPPLVLPPAATPTWTFPRMLSRNDRFFAHVPFFNASPCGHSHTPLAFRVIARSGQAVTSK